MAHFSTLLMVPVDEVTKRHTRESLSGSAAHTFGCSHFIAAHPRIKPILDGGTPIDTEMWQPVAKPHYHLPAELSAAIATLEDLEATEPKLQKDEWTLGEVHKLRDACRYAADHGLAMVVFHSNTLSKPPLRTGPPTPSSDLGQSLPERHSGIRSPMTARKCFVVGAVTFLSGLCLRIGMIFYAKVLLQKMETAFAKATNPDFLVSEALMHIKIGSIVSYLLMLAGTGVLLLGVARNRKVIMPPSSPVN